MSSGGFASDEIVPPMDFLLECIGFPPSVGESELVDYVRERGEPAAWRGTPEDHRVLALGGGLEVRADRDPGASFWSLTPQLRVPERRRLGVTSIVRPGESPFDALLIGWGAPPSPTEPLEDGRPGLYRLATWITDARRLEGRIAPGHVLAVSVAGFAVHVDRVVENEDVAHPSILDRPAGAAIRPVGGADAPGGCCDVSMRIRAVQHIRNEATGRTVEIAVCDAPDRPMALLLSPWQLERDGVAPIRPGWRVEGSFVFTGRLAGGLVRRKSSTWANGFG